MLRSVMRYITHATLALGFTDYDMCNYNHYIKLNNKTYSIHKRFANYKVKKQLDHLEIFT